MKFYFIFFFSFFSFSQTDNFDGLSKFSMGFSNSNFFDTESTNGNPDYKASIETYNSQSIFFDYRFFNKNNHAFKTGIFLNKFNKRQTFEGSFFVNETQEYLFVESLSNKSLADKTTNIEVYLDYNYLLKIYKDFYLQLGAGISYVHNKPQDYVDETVLIGNSFIDPNTTTDQLVAYGIYIEERVKWRSHLSLAAGYKTKFGLINLGLKYSLPFNKEVLYGNMTFYDPGPNGENYEYFSFFKNSGKYISATLSFTPSKNLFKKKK